MASLFEKKTAECLKLLKNRNFLLATAESCTGGGLGAAFTAVPGSSEVYLGGVVAYSNEIKSLLLDVPMSLIESQGAVSATVAQKMADSVREKLGAQLGIGITGIAGPGGGTPEKPVGTVYVALSYSPTTRVDAIGVRLELKGTREQIRNATLDRVMDLILRSLN